MKKEQSKKISWTEPTLIQLGSAHGAPDQECSGFGSGAVACIATGNSPLSCFTFGNDATSSCATGDVGPSL